MLSFLREYAKVQHFISKRPDVVFYAENAYYFQYFRHLFDSLRKENVSLGYITSDPHDPILLQPDEKLEVLYSKSTLAFVFQRLHSPVVIMTMPDLGNFVFKKSPAVGKYIYVFHALVSTHQQYRTHAFDHYDTIFCAGPHHAKEMREAESLNGLPQRELVQYGYPLLEEFKLRAKKYPADKKRVLIAPSWYRQGILNSCINELADSFSNTSYEVLVRPHPEFAKRNKKSYKKLVDIIEQNNNLKLDVTPSLGDLMLTSHYLVTDRSGIAFEYAFARQQPVLFIDTPLKIENDEYAKFVNSPVENTYREMIGTTMKPTDVSFIQSKIGELDNKRYEFEAGIHAAEREIVFDESYHYKGIQYIMDHLR